MTTFLPRPDLTEADIKAKRARLRKLRSLIEEADGPLRDERAALHRELIGKVKLAELAEDSGVGIKAIQKDLERRAKRAG